MEPPPARASFRCVSCRSRVERNRTSLDHGPNHGQGSLIRSDMDCALRFRVPKPSERVAMVRARPLHLGSARAWGSTPGEPWGCCRRRYHRPTVSAARLGVWVSFLHSALGGWAHWVRRSRTMRWLSKKFGLATEERPWAFVCYLRRAAAYGLAAPLADGRGRKAIEWVRGGAA